jgi:hypothetical protein
VLEEAFRSVLIFNMIHGTGSPGVGVYPPCRSISVAIIQGRPLKGVQIWTGGGGAEVIPVKDPHTRIKPLALASGSGHGRYIRAQ